MKIETKLEFGDVVETTCFARPIRGYVAGIFYAEACLVDVQIRHVLPDGKVETSYAYEKYLKAVVADAP